MRRVAGRHPDGGPLGDVAIHALCVERVLGHVEERDVGVLHVPRAVGVRVGADTAVGVVVADAVDGRAD